MTSVQETVYLIDGSAFIYRAYHAIRGLSTAAGHPTNATFGVTRILLKLLKEKTPAYAAVLLDVKGPTFRHDLFADYKANRPPMPEDLGAQIPDILAVISALNIPIVQKTGYEADDLVGTFSRLAREAGYRVVMVSGDKDFIQLITDGCTLWDPMKDTVSDVETVRTTLGIAPHQFVDILALSGDTSDNIPGVRGVGPKTATDLIVRFGSIDNVYAGLTQLEKKKKLYEALSSSREIVDLSRKLALIDQFVPVDRTIESFRLGPVDAPRAHEVFTRLEFRDLSAEFAAAPEPRATNYTTIRTVAELNVWAEILTAAKEFAIDTETTSRNPMFADLVGISFCCRADTAAYLPLGHTRDNAEITRDQVREILGPVLKNPDIRKVGQNIKYDMIVLERYGLPVTGIAFDTMIASYLLNPSHRGHSLDHIALTLFGHRMISYEAVTGKGKNQIGFHEVAVAEATRYSAEDADMTFRAWRELKEKLSDQGLADLMDRLEMPLISVLADMEMTGVQVDTAALHLLSEVFGAEMETLEQEIYALSGEVFNINSSQQLEKILFEKLGLETQKKTRKKTGFSTDVEVLTQLARTHDLPERVLRYRTLGKLRTTYADALISLVHPETGRIHTSFNQTITATGRLSSSSPNLQNIPVRKSEGRQIRQAFIPKAGHVLVSADYSQIELRILAHCAEDDILMESFRNDEDIHTRTAQEVFQVMPGLVTDALRTQAKAINFGIIYGMSAFRLARELNISRKMAATYIDNYFSRYAGVRQFIENTIRQTRDTLETRTLFGRIRKLPDIRSDNTNLRGAAERIAINTPIQGSAADLIKRAMIRMAEVLAEHRMGSRMVLTVHDEIIFEVPEPEHADLIALAGEVMTRVHPLKVPLKVNFGSGPNWAAAAH